MDTSTDPLFEAVDAIATAIVVSILIYFVLTLISLAAMCILYKKAGERGWTALVPIYNIFQMSKIATGSFKTANFYLVSILSYFLMIGLNYVIIIFSNLIDSAAAILLSLLAFALMLLRMGALLLIVGIYMALCYRFTQSFGKSAAMCRLSMFFSPIIFMIMGFNPKTEYIGPQ